MLAKRHHDLTARRTQSVCRLHALLCALTEGGLPKNLSAQRASSELRRIRPVDAVGIARREIALELLGEIRRVDTELTALRTKITAAVRSRGHNRDQRVRRRTRRRRLRVPCAADRAAMRSSTSRAGPSCAPANTCVVQGASTQEGSSSARPGVSSGDRPLTTTPARATRRSRQIWRARRGSSACPPRGERETEVVQSRRCGRIISA